MTEFISQSQKFLLWILLTGPAIAKSAGQTGVFRVHQNDIFVVSLTKIVLLTKKRKIRIVGSFS